MKELSIEEKAKAYDEALERATKLYENANGMILKKWVEQVFPALAESEDERIIKFISNELACLRATDEKGSDRYEELTNAIVWLEKQGEQNLVKANEEWYDFIRWFVKERTDNYTLIPSDDDIHKWGDMILNHAQKIFENQGEQKEYNVCDTCDEKASCVNPCPTKLVEQNSAWSEEDEKNINFLCELLTDLQVKSTENEIKYGTNSHSKYYHDTKDWLKSLKDRYTWKPSSEQMRVLDLAIRCGINRGTTEETTLVSLFNDLKKLKL